MIEVFSFLVSDCIQKHLAEQSGQRSGKKLSRAMLHTTLTQLLNFCWLHKQFH
jgi:hypothetical protein